MTKNLMLIIIPYCNEVNKTKVLFTITINGFVLKKPAVTVELLCLCKEFVEEMVMPCLGGITLF